MLGRLAASTAPRQKKDAAASSKAAGQSPALPASFPAEHLGEFPYNQELVFRNGQYVIHRVNKTAAPLNPQFAPLASRSSFGASGVLPASPKTDKVDTC